MAIRVAISWPSAGTSSWPPVGRITWPSSLHRPDLRVVQADDHTTILRLLSDRRDELPNSDAGL
jgi:hypothetical protein